MITIKLIKGDKMDQITLKKMAGEWTGTGQMTVGDCIGHITEYLKIEETDLEFTYSYIRKSSINFTRGKANGTCDPHTPDVVLHNELGYITAKHRDRRGNEKQAGTNLLLSRGSYIIMNWSDDNGAFVEDNDNSSPDSKDMKRTISQNNDATMIWDNVMMVDQGRRDQEGKIIWASHNVTTEFSRIN